MTDDVFFIKGGDELQSRSWPTDFSDNPEPNEESSTIL
jgi:hypothetical protein